MPRRGRGARTHSLQRITLGLQLPSFGASLDGSLVIHSQTADWTRPFALSSFPVLLRDELLFGFLLEMPLSNQKWDPGAQAAVLAAVAVFKSCWRLLVPPPLSLNPPFPVCPPPHPTPHPPAFPAPPSTPR